MGSLLTRTFSFNTYSLPFSMTSWSNHALEPCSFVGHTMSSTPVTQVFSHSFTLTWYTHFVTLTVQLFNHEQGGVLQVYFVTSTVQLFNHEQGGVLQSAGVLRYLNSTIIQSWTRRCTAGVLRYLNSTIIQSRTNNEILCIFLKMKSIAAFKRGTYKIDCRIRRHFSSWKI